MTGSALFRDQNYPHEAALLKLISYLRNQVNDGEIAAARNFYRTQVLPGFDPDEIRRILAAVPELAP